MVRGPLIAATFLTLWPAAAQAAPITGNAQPNMTVVALAKDGRSWSTVAGPSGRFAVVVPSGSVTLQLRDRAGRYAGPVVVAGSSSKAILGVKAGASLGTLKLKKGAAFPAARVSSKAIDKRFSARAVKGVPTGAGRLGLGGTPVKASSAQAGGTSDSPLAQPGADPDADGLPNAVDVDDNGNKLVDAVDPALAATAVSGFAQFTQIFLNATETTNIDADPGSQANIEARMRARLLLIVGRPIPADTTLDCGGLSWCSPGGTGHLKATGPTVTPGQPFPNGTNATMYLAPNGEFRLVPGAGPNEIRAGDTLIQKRADGTQLAAALGFVFVTVPAIKTWSTGTGYNGSVSYPVAAGASGTPDNPVTVSPDAQGKRSLTIEFWRPQRYSIAGAEPSGFYDIGHLGYRANLPPPTGAAPDNIDPSCPVSTLTPGPGLSASTSAGAGPRGSLVDDSDDRPSDPTRTLTMTIDIDACAAARGITLTSGLVIPFDLGGFAIRPGAADHANQMFFIKVG